jgi:hypothetical protein
MLKPLDVIAIFDGTLREPKPKLVASIVPEEGWFYRINSRPFLRPWVALLRDPDHTWLQHDSYLHCEILMLDDYIVEESIERHGIIGTIAPMLKPDIRKWTLQARYISSSDSAKICSVLAD